MAVTAANLAMGPGDVYVGSFGAPEPLDSQVNGTPAASAWTSVGGTMGGITVTFVTQWKELEVDQLVETPERRTTKREVQVKTRFAEVTFDNLVLALVGGTITPGASGTQDAYDPPTSDSSASPTYKAVIFDGVAGNGLRRRLFVRKVLSTESVEAQNSKDDQQSYPVTFTSHYVDSVTKSWRLVNKKA
jgi:hypothetical protein